MMEIILNYLRIFILPAEVLAAALLYMQPLRHRSHYILRIVLGALFLVVAFLATSFFLLQGILAPLGIPSSGFVRTLLYSFGSYALAALLSLFSCSVTPPEALYCATCAYLTQHVAYSLNRLLTPGIVEGNLSSYSPRYFLIYGGGD